MKIFFSLVVYFFVLPYQLSFANLIEEEISQAFVLETRQLEIPGFKCAFNPSLIVWNDNTLLSFRVRNAKLDSTFEIGMVWLDEQLCPRGSAQILDIRSNHVHKFNKEQDPRLVLIKEHLYIVYSNDVEIDFINPPCITRRVCVCKVNYDGVNFSAEPPDYLLKFPGERTSRWEKNWVPFEYNDNLLLAYSISPHKIFKPLLGSTDCDLVDISSKNIPWAWGELRGGTPALRLNETQYLAFFHSSTKMATKHSNGAVIPHYVMGAYVYNAFPPFEITHISPEPIIARNFYSGLSYKTYRPVCVVFPGGYIFDKDYIWIAYGRQDHEIWLVKLDKDALLKSLVALETQQAP